MFRQGRSTLDIKLKTLMMKDSLEMTDEDREVIAQNCISCQENHILITHGTDTMDLTAAYLASRVKNKTVVLTGAMIPFSFGSSDGFFNLGSAMAFVQTLPPNVYVVMNGQYFLWNNVRKNREHGLFEKITENE
jgi:L-asparaginase